MKLKIFQLLWLACVLTANAQTPTQPILRVENGMHTGVATKITTDTANKYLLTGSEDKTARLWNAADGQLLNILRIPIGDTDEGKITACALSPDGTIAALGGSTGYEWDATYCIYILNTQTGSILHRIALLPKRISDLQFSPDGKWLAAGFTDGAGVSIFETATWGFAKKLESTTGNIIQMAFDKNNRLLTLTDDRQIYLYNKRFRFVNFVNDTDIAYPYAPISISFNPSGSLIAVGYLRKDYEGYNNIQIRDGKDCSRKYFTSGESHALSFSNNGLALYTGGTYRHPDSNDVVKNALKVLSNDPLKYSSYIPLMKDNIIAIKTLSNGNVVVLGTYPEIAVLSPLGKLIWYRSAATNQFYNLSTNNSGTSIAFTTYSKDTVSFDATTRSMSNRNSFPNPGGVSQGFRNNGFDVEHLTTHFVEKNETLRWFIRGEAGEILVATDKHFYKVKYRNYDGIETKTLWKIPLPSLPFSSCYNSNKMVIIIPFADGTIRWYSVKDGKELLAFYLDSDLKRWILFTPSGFYDASPGAEGMLGWNINNGKDAAPSFYPVSRFRQQFYRPDIVDAVLKTYDEAEAVTQANAGNKKNLIVHENIKEKLPPVVTIANPVSGTTVSNQLVKVSYSVKSPENAPVKKIKVLVNGRPITFETGVKDPVSDSYSITVNIPQSACTLTLLAENDYGVSPEANLYLKWQSLEKPKEAAVKKPILYILAIGISDYQNVDYKLNYAAADANGFINAIRQQKGNLYEDVIIKPLIDRSATREGIQDGLQWIQDQTSHQDIAMIFYAGHGINDNNGIFYMLPVGADITRLRSTCLNFEELKQTVSNIAGKVVVFIDACHSGNVMGESGRRGVTDINAVINELSATQNGAVTFTSSTGNEYSLEDAAWKHGAFTKALLEGLGGKAAIQGQNKITVKSLDVFISERVKELTKGKQHPTSVVPPNVPDFPIAAW